MTVKVDIKKLKENAFLPTRGSANAAGYDLYACLEEMVTICPGETKMIPTGLAIAVPCGYAGFIYARSGLATKSGLAPANKVGVCDSDYRGEYLVSLHNHGTQEVTVTHGQRIAQLIIAPYLDVCFHLVKELEETERGSGGFGSTGA